ncbi:MAG TPA: sigma-54 dependent transcriptional regulator [Terriglobia bacterium]|nr:sigma-54 dependent transcriptional regulator [Terriglobia bacterium]
MRDVLVVDDELGMRAALEASFRRQGWRVRTAGGKNEAVAAFRSAPCPLVVTDMRMGDGSGLEVIQEVRALQPETIIIVLTAFGSVTDAVTAMKGGAFDYLIKPVAFDQLQAAIGRAFASQEGTAAVSAREDSHLVQGSGSFRAVLERARQVARTEADIVVEAESGTGKEVLARFVHRNSLRSAGPFVAINCAAFPEHLLESELFGHVRGAFTGATNNKPGKFELAHTGTLLLDEIGEMPLNLQPKLLRVLQEREVDRLGDTRPVKVDVRVIATTNRSLRALIQEGKFRQDLYYRLNVVPLAIPPLREHATDIPELIEHFIAKHSSSQYGSAVRFSAELLQRMQSYGWPGNIRELENFVRRALALSPGPLVGVEVLDGIDFPQSVPTAGGALEAGLTLREVEKQLLARTLAATGGNRTHAAMMLGISLRTVRNKIREYGLPPRGQEVSYGHVG